MIWINMQVTKKMQPFNYARLEEATFYQYAYGHSASLINQAGRFLAGFAQKKPFTSGNDACAFVGVVAFLKMNGMTINLSDDTAAGWIERTSKDSTAATEALTDIAVPDESYRAHNAPGVRESVLGVMEAYPKTLSLLSRGRALAGV